MDVRDYWQGSADYSEVPLVIGCDNRTAWHLEGSDLNRRLICGFRPGSSRQSTPGTPNPSTAEDSTWYGLRRNTKAIREGYRFGARDKVHFELVNYPGSNRVSGLHFRILLTEFNTWVLIEESASSTRVNEEKLVSQRAHQKASRSGVVIEGNSMVALRSNEPNAVEIGSLNFNVYVNGDPADFQPTPAYAIMPSLDLLELRSRPSLSTAFADSKVDLLSLEEQAEYYILPDCAKARDPQTKIQKMVHKDTGAVVVGKSYAMRQRKAMQAHYNRLGDILIAGCQNNLIPFLSQTLIESKYTIITEYWPQSTTLKELLEKDLSTPLPSEASFGFMFAQLLEALQFLAQNNVIHRDIKPAAILIATTEQYPSTLGMAARLSGFSESIVGHEAKEVVGCEQYRAPEMNGKAYDAKVDVYALSKLVKEGPSLRRKRPCKDPLSDVMDQGLTQDPARRASASHLCDSFRCFTSGHYGEPFHFFYVRRRFDFACTYSFDMFDSYVREKYVRVADVLDVLAVYTGCDRMVASERLGPLKVAENGNRFDGSYCRLQKAKKLFSRCKIFWAKELMSRELEKPSLSSRDPAWFFLSTSVDFRIHYHAPSMMMNITELVRITGRPGYTIIQDASAPALIQEVRGEAVWEGIYIDQESFTKICELLERDSPFNFSVVTKDLKSIESAALRDRFVEIDSSKYIVLVTNRVIPDIMLFNRKDCSVNMRYVRADDPAGDGSVSAETAIAECGDLGLENISVAITELMSQQRNLNWRSHWADEEEVPECSSTSSVASASSYSFRFQPPVKGQPNSMRPLLTQEDDQNRVPSSVSSDEDDDSGIDEQTEKIQRGLARSHQFPWEMKFHRDGPTAAAKGLPDGPHEHDYMLNPTMTKSSMGTQLKDILGHSFHEVEKPKPLDASISPFATKQINRYDGYVESQRFASKRPFGRSRLEPYIPWQPPTPSDRNVESWLQNQNAVDASKDSFNDTEETPKKRRVADQSTTPNVPDSQGSGDTDRWNDVCDDEELPRLKMSVDAPTLAKPQNASRKKSATPQSTRKARAEDSTKGHSGSRASR